MSRLLRFAAISTCVVALFGCGSSSDDSSSSGDTSATTGAGATGQFATDLSNACSTGAGAVDAAAADFSTAVNDLHAATSREEYQAAVTDLQSATGDLVSALQEFKASIQALDPPEDLADARDQLASAINDQLAVAQTLTDAPTNSATSFDAALTAVQQDDSAAREARAQAANDLGSDACVPADVGGPGTGTGTGGGGGATTTTGG